MSTTPGPGWSPALLAELTEAASPRDAAVLLAGAGVPVFPCAPGGKHPLTARGFHGASTDHDIVGSWWSRWPGANLAIPTGAVSGVDVVDVDVHESGSGFAAFDRATRAGLTGRWAWLVRTPHGGVHACFLRGPDAGEQRSWQAPGAHVDFRGDGGYVLAPPSTVRTEDGRVRAYELIAVAAHTPGPVDAARLRALLTPPRPPASGLELSPAAGASPERLAAWVAARPQGGRNHGLYWAACRMVEAGHHPEHARAVLGEAARAAGLPAAEIDRTIRSAYRHADARAGPSPGPRPARTGPLSL